MVDFQNKWKLDSPQGSENFLLIQSYNDKDIDKIWVPKSSKEIVIVKKNGKIMGYNWETFTPLTTEWMPDSKQWQEKEKKAMGEGKSANGEGLDGEKDTPKQGESSNRKRKDSVPYKGKNISLKHLMIADNFEGQRFYGYTPEHLYFKDKQTYFLHRIKFPEKFEAEITFAAKIPKRHEIIIMNSKKIKIAKMGPFKAMKTLAFSQNAIPVAITNNGLLLEIAKDKFQVVDLKNWKPMKTFDLTAFFSDEIMGVIKYCGQWCNGDYVFLKRSQVVVIDRKGALVAKLSLSGRAEVVTPFEYKGQRVLGAVVDGKQLVIYGGIDRKVAFSTKMTLREEVLQLEALNDEGMIAVRTKEGLRIFELVLEWDESSGHTKQ